MAAYEVRLSPEGRGLEWIERSAAGEKRYDTEPETTWLLRAKVEFLSILPIEWREHKINIIDVPGYPDFIGDLHAIARVVESMIIVCEAKADLDVGFELAWD